MEVVAKPRIQNSVTLDEVKANNEGGELVMSDKLKNMQVQDVKGDIYVKPRKDEDTGKITNWIGIRIQFKDSNVTTFLRASLRHVKEGLLKPSANDASILVFGPERLGWENGTYVIG